ncbi:hypothetical protein, partial [Mesorhizobium ciceri]|uniref:hypothetical protein n=1 Tax=Mesorhizobium ciceri TaxID=39645 RepID=UPI00344CE8C1
FFVVPMNALLQHRGHVLLSAGHSIAVQNFNENLSVLIMLSVIVAGRSRELERKQRAARQEVLETRREEQARLANAV